MLSSVYISDQEGINIVDPFCMKDIEEKHSLEDMQNAQLNNTIIATFNDTLIGLGRLLEVSGNIELVSLSVNPTFRQKGIGKRLIELRLQHTKYWPIYSFVNLKAKSSKDTYLFEYYLQAYAPYGGYIPKFEELPVKLQCDLSRMNDFWGSYLIIKIQGEKFK